MGNRQSHRKSYNVTTELSFTTVSDQGINELQGPNNPTIPYPKSVFFIVANEFCERFTFYGLRTVLVLYLNYVLLYSVDDATVIYHVFNMLAYFFPVLGAIAADSWLGKYKTIFFLSIVYAIGSIVISVTAIDSLNIPQGELTMVGLVLIAIGTGGIKPCVSAFGGDQFVSPQQDLQLQRFFSVFYFAINAGSLISTFLTPVLREDVHCFGKQSCFSLAFGVPAILMIVAIVAFVLGSRWYKIKAPDGNIVVKVSKCIWYASTRGESNEKREHWLDKADDRYERKFIEDIKSALKVLVMFTPVPIFWALFDQQGSRWTFQAARMSGDLGNGFYIKPDQVQIFNPVMTLLFIPLFELVIYPAFGKCNMLKRPLQKMVVGGILAGAAFVISAAVEFNLHSTYPVLPVSGEGQLRLYNAAGCDLQMTLDTVDPFIVKNLGMWENRAIPMISNNTDRDLNVSWRCQGSSAQNNSTLTIFNNQATSYTFTMADAPYQSTKENLDKSENGDPMLMFIYSSTQQNFSQVDVTVRSLDGRIRYQSLLNSTAPTQRFHPLPRGSGYKAYVDGKEAVGTFNFEQGGSYVVVAEDDGSKIITSYHQVTEPNSINMMWLVPQYVVITAGEIMYSITGLEFAFTQAPASMKSLITSAWLLTVAFGNLVVIIVAEAKIFKNQAYEFLLFAGLMFLDVLLFMYLAMRYKYVEPKEDVIPNSQNNGNIPLNEKIQKD